MAQVVGFIGLGIMGGRMARNVLKAGYALRAYNRTAAKAEALRPLGRQSRPRRARPPGMPTPSSPWCPTRPPSPRFWRDPRERWLVAGPVSW